jgi:hypothetical protein
VQLPGINRFCLIIYCRASPAPSVSVTTCRTTQRSAVGCAQCRISASVEACKTLTKQASHPAFLDEMPTRDGVIHLLARHCRIPLRRRRSGRRFATFCVLGERLRTERRGELCESVLVPHAQCRRTNMHRRRRGLEVRAHDPKPARSERFETSTAKPISSPNMCAATTRIAVRCLPWHSRQASLKIPKCRRVGRSEPMR